MTTPEKILVDLLAGQSTSDALAERMRIPMLSVRAMCERHQKEGLLDHTKIADVLVVWALTYDGRITAEELKTKVRGAKPGTANVAR